MVSATAGGSSGLLGLRVDPVRAAIYAPEVIARIPWLLGHMDREPESRTYGSFDRDFWAWKFRDFPLGMLQAAAYPLALLWRYPFPDNPYLGNDRVLEWIGAAIERSLASQHRNGALDAFSPNEQDGGSTLAVAHALSEAFRLVRDELPPARQERFLSSLRRACDFGRTRDENHAFISNHRAFFAVALLDAHELLGDQVYLESAEALVTSVLEQQSTDGWYREYGGPDPGYESFGIFHLATYWRRTGSSRVLESLRRSVEFYAHCIHPDGSVGGVYGSRHTSLYFPAGLEILSRELPLAAAAARFMRDRLGRRNVVTPGTADLENYPPLAYTYLEACLGAGNGSPREEVQLPCEVLSGVRRFPDSTLAVAGTPHYYAVVNPAKGGVCRVFGRGSAALVYEDAGYLVRSGSGAWTSQLIGFGRVEETGDGNEIASTTALGEARQELATPARFVLLRVLNLTLFRSPFLGSLLRRWIIARLITSRRPGPFRLSRRIHFEADRITVHDRLSAVAGSRVDAVELPRRLTAIHMGSAKYFHPSELEMTPVAPVEGMAQALSEKGSAECAFAIRFSEVSTPVLEVAIGGSNVQSQQTIGMGRT